MKVIVAIVFVCLATGANAGLLNKMSPFSSHSETEYNLESLEKWLNKTAPDEGYTDADVGLLKSNVGRFKSRKLERTAQLVLDVADLNQCDQQALAKLNELAKAKVVYRGKKRTERILKKPMEALYESCGKYVDEQLGAFSENLLDERQRQFIKMIDDTELWRVAGGFLPRRHFEVRGYTVFDGRLSIWNNFFLRAARDIEGANVDEIAPNKETGKHETFYHRDRFDHVMKDYLLPSCESFMATVGGKFDFVALEGLARIPTLGYMLPHIKTWADFMKFRPRAVQQVASAHIFCSFAPQLLKDDFNGVYKMLKGDK